MTLATVTADQAVPKLTARTEEAKHELSARRVGVV